LLEAALNCRDAPWWRVGPACPPLAAWARAALAASATVAEFGGGWACVAGLSAAERWLRSADAGWFAADGGGSGRGAPLSRWSTVDSAAVATRARGVTYARAATIGDATRRWQSGGGGAGLRAGCSVFSLKRDRARSCRSPAVHRRRARSDRCLRGVPADEPATAARSRRTFGPQPAPRAGRRRTTGGAIFTKHTTGPLTSENDTERLTSVQTRRHVWSERHSAPSARCDYASIRLGQEHLLRLKRRTRDLPRQRRHAAGRRLIRSPRSPCVQTDKRRHSSLSSRPSRRRICAAAGGDRQLASPAAIHPSPSALQCATLAQHARDSIGRRRCAVPFGRMLMPA